jgi:hypothetical protein
MFINQCSWCDYASHFTSILRPAFCICGCVIQEFLRYGDMFVQILNQNLEITIKLICRKASLNKFKAYIK